MNPFLRKVLGETDASIIPTDAKKLSGVEDVVGKPLRPIEKVIPEPSRPSSDKEKYLTPLAALTAPDCTPDALKPLDSSSIPGGTGPVERFTSAEVEQEPLPEQPERHERSGAMRAMDQILGHQRTAAPARNPQEFDATGATMSESQAAALVNGLTVPGAVVESTGRAAAALATAQQGGAMPEPGQVGDGRAIAQAFRQFV